MFIDIHVHATTVPAPPRPTWPEPTFSTAEHLIARYDAVNIEKGVLLPLVSPEAMPISQSCEEILQIAERYPDRFIPFCNIDPRAMDNAATSDLGYLMRYYRDKGCKGIGEVTANIPFLDPLVQNLFKHAEETGFPLTFHVAAQRGNIYGLYDDPGLPQLERSLQRFPDLRFVAHSQSFWAEMAPLETVADRYGYPTYPIHEEGAVPRLFRRYPNLYGDLSAGSGCNALARDEAYAISFLTEY